MIDPKKKYWREKVTAEITLAHLQQFANELGTAMTSDEIVAFLNDKGRAQNMWMHMMQAGEEYVKANLAMRNTGIHKVNQSAAQAILVH